MRTLARLGLFLAFLAISLVVAGCDDAGGDSGGASPAAAPSLAGTSWSAFTINGVRPIGPVAPTIRFTDSAVSGSAGCNSYGGTYGFEPGSGAIRFDEKALAMTAMACVDERIMNQEGIFVRGVSTATKATRTGDGRLILTGPAGEIVFVAEHEG